MGKIELNNIENLGYEESYAELERVIAALEAGEHSLDDTINLFERGKVIARHCREILDKAELKVQSLTEENTEKEKRAK
jgi:exodeoxyribonuclease VII small subunit